MNDNLFDKKYRSYYMGGAILWIYFFHLYSGFVMYPESVVLSLFKPFRYGYTGVDVFLFLSSYGLCASLESNQLKTYYKNRVIRILPSYVCFYLLLLVLFWHNLSILKIVGHLIINITGGAVFIIGEDIEWYTPSIMLIYILFPIVYKTIRKIRDRISIVGVSIIIFIFIVLSKIAPSSWWSQVLLLYRLPIILIGILSYICTKKESNRSMQLSLYSVALLIALLSMDIRIILSLLVPSLLYIMWKAHYFPFYSFLTFLGKYSYELFLSQVLMTKFLFNSHYLDGNIILLVSVIGTVVLTSFIILMSNQIKRLIKR